MGADTVAVNDLAGNDTVSIGATQLTRGLESVHYNGSIASLIFNDPTGVHTYNATSSPGTAITVNGSGQDTLNFDATGLNETIGFNTITAPGRQPFTFNGIGHFIVTPVTLAVQADSFVRRVYPDVLGRGVDPSGLQTWVGMIVNGTPFGTVASDILTSAEHRTQQINGYYEKYLGRPVDAGGLGNWLSQFKGGATEETVQLGILQSAEFMNAHASDASFVTALYLDLFNRNPDPGGFAAWSNFLKNGVPRATVISDFLVSDEYRLDAIDAYYLQLLHRKADAGAQHWLQVYDTGSTQDAIAADLLTSQEYLNDR
jgi:hypothetical protein